MIQWWGWLLIWVGLVVTMLGMLALFTWRLFRKFLGLVDDVADLTDRLDVFDSVVDEPRLPATALAVLASDRDVRAREQARRARRRGLSEQRHERRMARAHRIGSVTVSEVRWPAAWYRRARRPQQEP